MEPRVLKTIHDLLRDAYGERLRGGFLYGLEARGQATPFSDIAL